MKNLKTKNQVQTKTKKSIVLLSGRSNDHILTGNTLKHNEHGSFIVPKGAIFQPLKKVGVSGKIVKMID